MMTRGREYPERSGSTSRHRRSGPSLVSGLAIVTSLAVAAPASGPVGAQAPGQNGIRPADAVPTHPQGSRTPRGSRSSPERASFSVRFRNEASAYRVLGLFVLPGERVELRVLPDGEQDAEFRVSAPGRVSAREQNRFVWDAPWTSGTTHEVVIRREEPRDSILLNAFVLFPFDSLTGETLNGYRIGRYPATPLRGLAIYRPPRGFIEVTPENRHTLVSPHFRLDQFLCKQASGWPKYVVLKERLLLKLEALLEEANAAGHTASTFAVLSGYRTPYYNRAIGNVRYSRHVWGDAADIYIDESPPDGTMDDLNGDGRIDYRDAGVLYDLVDQLSGRSWYAPFIGGLGRYRKTRAHGPFVHVDTRGFRARWGTF